LARRVAQAIDKDIFRTMFQIGYRRLLIADFGGARAVVASMNKPISKPQALQERLISHAAVLLEVSANLPIRRKPRTFPDSYCAQVLQPQRITVKRAALKAVRTLFTSSELC
jgi:hypothetical protein